MKKIMFINKINNTVTLLHTNLKFSRLNYIDVAQDIPGLVLVRCFSTR